MNLGLSEELTEIREKIRRFVDEKVEPVEAEYLAEINVGDRWSHTARQDEILNGLKQEARKQGLWNFFLPESQGGAGISNLEYAHLAEIMGRSRLASESMNCSAPDTGNMEVLERFGSEEQKKQWLEPLLAGEIRSAFAMTEPNVASSDATNISTSAVLDGGEWVINGEKFYISGAGDARCKIMIVMVVTDPGAPRHNRQSQILVPKDTPGVEIVRPMCVFGHDDAPPRPHAYQVSQCAGAGKQYHFGPRQGFRDFPGPAWSGPDSSLHALDRRGGEGARPDVQARGQPRGFRQAAGGARRQLRCDRRQPHRD